MNSIVLSNKSLQVGMFDAFSSFLFIDGIFIVNGWHDDENFHWSICHYVPVKQGWRGLGVGDKVFHYSFYRSAVELRSISPADYQHFFTNEFEKMVNEFDEKILRGMPMSFTEQIENAWFPADVFPNEVTAHLSLTPAPGTPKEGMGYSEDVLIDVYGDGMTYRVGWYDFDEKKWVSDYKDSEQLHESKELRWRHIPK